MQKKIALVTGAASGMGRIYARTLVEQGFHVVAIDVNASGLRDTAAGSDDFTPITCNIADHAEVAAIVESIELDVGVIESAVHCAAIMPGRAAINEDMTSLRRLMDINYFGTLAIIDTVVRRMAERNRGRVVVFGSVAGDAMVPNMASYCATKAAVNVYTESLINELRFAGSKVNVHLVKPPAVDTPLVDQLINTETPGSIITARETGRLADPEKIVAAIERSIARGKTVIYPGSARLLSLWHCLLPRLWWKTVSSYEKKPHTIGDNTFSH